MSVDNIDEVLDYLTEWRSGCECKERFNLSQQQHVNLFRWLYKANLIQVCKGSTGDVDLDKVDGRIFYYKVKQVTTKIM